MNRGKLQQFMDSMMKLSKNMDARLLGNILMMPLIIYLWAHSLMEKYFAFMEVYHHKLKPLIKCEPLTVKCKFPMKVNNIILRIIL